MSASRVQSGGCTWRRKVTGLDRGDSAWRLRNNWVSSKPQSLPALKLSTGLAMASFSRSNVFRNASRSLTFGGSRRGAANKAYPDHIPLSTFEHAFLTVGTGLTALLDPRRGGEYDKREVHSTQLIDYG